MKRSLIAVGAFLSLAVAGVVSAAPQVLSEAPAELTALDAPPSVNKDAQTYIVQLSGDPIIAYEGGIKGYAATKPGKGQKLNPQSKHVRKYAARLESQQDGVIAAVGGENHHHAALVQVVAGFVARVQLRGKAGA